jgi:putative ABC transport system ATP-binding protein
MSAVNEIVEDTVVRPPTRALHTLRRGLATSPELAAGVRSALALALATGFGRVTVPIALRVVIDRGLAHGYRPGIVLGTTATAAVVLVVVTFLYRAAMARMVRSSQDTLYGLRVRLFAHVHELSVAHHNESKRGILVTRVTSDIETLAMFAQWGAMSWIVNSAVVVVTLLTMAAYSWQLALVAIVVFIPVAPLMVFLQRRQLRAYDRQREAVADTLTEISESVMGAPVVRAYGLTGLVRGRLHQAIDRQYRANRTAAGYFSTLFALSDLVGALAVASVIGVGVWWGPAWGLTQGSVVACLFLTSVLLTPIGEIGEVLDSTQTALAGWQKVLDLLDTPVEVVEPTEEHTLADGALSVAFDHVNFAYEPGHPVLRDVDLVIEAGSHVAIVGETGSGKTTLASLICRLADPTSGSVVVGGRDLRQVGQSERVRRIRMIPQDAFLFDGSIGDNVRLGRRGATEADVRAAFQRLGLDGWLQRLPAGLATQVGERGSELSVGERQLVSLARAEIGTAGVLILDEATSSVDPETERILNDAQSRLTEGRTTISIAHRLSTAETAAVVVVMEHGRVVQVGSHAELVTVAGRYRDMYDSWIRNTRK